MSKTIERAEWPAYIRDFTDRNKGRPTRLGILKMHEGVVNDFWLEDGLPLVALDVYDDHAGARLDMVFNDYTHTIDGVARLDSIQDSTGEGLDIADGEGTTTQLRFEDWLEPNKQE